MAIKLKAFWHKVRIATQAAEDLKHLAAISAMEMVVMLLARNFVPSSFTGQFHRHQPRFVHQRADGSVDRGDAQALNLVLRHFANLFGRKRTLCFQEHVANGSTLLGVSYCCRHGVAFWNPCRTRRSRHDTISLYCISRVNDTGPLAGLDFLRESGHAELSIGALLESA